MNREKVIFPEEMVRRHPPLYDKCFYGKHQQNIQRNYRNTVVGTLKLDKIKQAE